MVADLNGPGAEQVAGGIRAAGGWARAVQVDVTDPVGLSNAIDAAAAEAGQLDFMFNNAGISLIAEVRDMTPEYWRSVIDVNLLGVAYGVQFAYQRMVAQRSGHIVNTASMYGIMPASGLAAYSAAKYGVVALSYALRGEAHKLGVRVSVICPGYADTSIHANTECPGLDRDRLFARIGPPHISAAGLAEAALTGVARGRFLIMAPSYVSRMWWGHKLSPKLTELALVQGARLLRQVRQPQPGAR